MRTRAAPRESWPPVEKSLRRASGKSSRNASTRAIATPPLPFGPSDAAIVADVARSGCPGRGVEFMARSPSCMLAACPTAWDEDYRLDEHHFRREVQLVLEAGFDHLYVFGTGSEGDGVDTARFTQVARAFWGEANGAHPLIGGIGLSTANVVERLRIAYDIGFREFQISLPSWGVVTDAEMLRFFVDVCGTFPDAVFLHYNLPRTKRVLNGTEYARLIREVPNLVA